MSRFRLPGGRARDARDRPRVGLFGILGAGNIGNDASLEAMLKYLRADQPGAILDAMCTGPETVKHRYGVPAIALQWLPQDVREASGPAATALKALGKGIDTIRIASWVRRHEVVIVPGTGVLETTLRKRPWQGPYTMLVLCVSGRIFRTKVALVSVGADVGSERLTRWLFAAAGRFAFYRSYRDELSRDAMAQQGVDTSKDRVYTDLAFGLPVPSSGPGAERTVGIGLMDYYGNDDSHGQPDEVRASYVGKMKSFTRWLVDNGRRVRLFVGDTNNVDETVVEEILADLRTHRPDLDPTRVVADPVVTFADLMRAMEPGPGGRHSLPQCGVRAHVVQADDLYRVRRKERGADGRRGTGRVLPVGGLPGRGTAHRAVHRVRTPRGAAAGEGHRGKRGKGAARRGSARGAVGGTVPNARSGSEPGRPAKPQSAGRI